MSDTSKDFPAFPRNYVEDGHNGMTLRDYFAAKAMAALMAEDIDDGQSTSEYIEETACGAYKYADAMLRARGAT